MCHPMALAGASFIVGAAQAVAKNQAQHEDANAMEGFQRQERYNAEVARNTTYDKLQQRQNQEIDQASQALMDNQIRAVKARATGDTSAAESGMHGNSVESVARNFYTEQGRIDAATVRNNAMTVQQLQDEKKQTAATYASRVNQPAVRRPNALSLGLEIASAGVNAFDLYERRNKKPTG